MGPACAAPRVPVRSASCRQPRGGARPFTRRRDAAGADDGADHGRLEGEPVLSIAAWLTLGSASPLAETRRLVGSGPQVWAASIAPPLARGRAFGLIRAAAGRVTGEVALRVGLEAAEAARALEAKCASAVACGKTRARRDSSATDQAAGRRLESRVQNDDRRRVAHHAASTMTRAPGYPRDTGELVPTPPGGLRRGTGLSTTAVGSALVMVAGRCGAHVVVGLPFGHCP